MKRLIFITSFVLLALVTTAHPPISIVIDNFGNVFFSDLEHVWKIDKSGKVSIAVKNVHTHQLHIDKEGGIKGENVWYIENGDIWAHYLWQLNASGEFNKLTGDIMEFPVNNYLVQDPVGNSYFSQTGEGEEVLIRESKSGHKKSLTNEPFTDIRWIQYSKQRKTLLVVDMTALKEVSMDGQVRTLANNFGKNTMAFSWVRDIHKIMGSWTDDKGNIYTSLYGAQKVVVIDKSGNMKDWIKTEGKWSPSGGVFDKEDNLWLLEFSSSNKVRVRQVTPDGHSQLFYPEK